MKQILKCKEALAIDPHAEPARWLPARSGDRWRRCLGSAILLAVLVVLPAGGKPKPPRIKLATLAPRGSSFHEILLEMGVQWREAPGGGVKLTVYPDGAMGGEADVVRKMRIGQVQAAMLARVGILRIGRIWWIGPSTSLRRAPRCGPTGFAAPSAMGTSRSGPLGSGIRWARRACPSSTGTA